MVENVSIQLVSPTSGEPIPSQHPLSPRKEATVSIQLVSPTSGESSMIHPRQRKVSRGQLRGSDIFCGTYTCVRSQ